MFDTSPTLKPTDLESALPLAKSLLRPNWLAAQAKRRVKDSVLADRNRPRGTRKEFIAWMRFGASKPSAHPIAAAILAADRALEDLSRGRRTVFSPGFYRVLSLADIARVKSRIPGIDSRLRRLEQGDWSSTLYELLVATGYCGQCSVEFVEESEQPTADLILRTEPITRVECKVRSYHSEKKAKFIEFWHREGLVPLYETLRKFIDSSVVRIKIKRSLPVKFYRKSLPRIVDSCIRHGLHESSDEAFSIRIEPWEPGPLRFSEPIPIIGRTIWERALAFVEWNEWDTVTQFGGFQYWEEDQRFAVAARNLHLICVHAEHIPQERLRLDNAIKSAARRQIGKERLGVVHYRVVDPSLAVATDEIAFEYMRSHLSPVLRDYSRMFRIYVHAHTLPSGSDEAVTARRFVVQNDSVSMPIGYSAPRDFICH